MPQVYPVAIFTVQPPLRGLTLTFAPEEFGYKDGPDGKPRNRENMKFDVEGRFLAYDEDTAARLRAHRGCVKNGGTMFSEVPQSVINQARALSGEVIVSAPHGGLTREDQNLLLQLDKDCSRNIVPNAKPAVIERLNTAIERFGASNFKAPPQEAPARLLRGRISELLYSLENQGIWSPPHLDEEPDARGTDSGAGLPANG